MRLDFTRAPRSGTSVLAFNVDGVRISLGAWTVVEIDGLGFEFDREEFDWTEESLQDPMGMGAGTLVHKTLEAASRLADVRTFRQVMELLQSAYVEGVRHGEQHKLEQVREVLGL